MKTLKNPYDLFDLVKSNLDYSLMDNFIFNNNQFHRPLSNIKDKQDEISIELIAPGYNKNEIEITIDNNILLVKGKKDKTTEIEKENIVLNEFYNTEFQRSFKINTEINIDSVKSKLENGILNISIPKAKKIENKKLIQIN